jgi:aspartyl-tRNA(Asn)/glutamyl-tRNA(Gln) amidotransferase subunit B
MSDYKVTIGLEIHAELKTRTKMFCNSKNDPDEKRPNVNICPVCMGYPGTLPTVNFEAVKHVVRVGVALGGEIADFTEFDRKNYFYPDIPKGYQISQYKYPIVKGGTLNGVNLTRIHLEEDTARSSHETGDYSLIDFNRAGIPLMELVTEPVIHSAQEASAFAKELQLLLQTLGAGDANMEKGEMRVEANISVSDSNKFGTKVEVKNLNSFKAVEKAIAFEIDRHTGLLKKGEKIVQETRGWDENKELTFSQRAKEDSHDYRYFPDPDIPKMKLSEVPELNPENIKKELPELPWEKREKYKNLGIKDEIVEVLVSNPIYDKLFNLVGNGLLWDREKVLLIVNYITSDIVGLVVNNKINLAAALDRESLLDSDEYSLVTAFKYLTNMLLENKFSSRNVKDMLPLIFKEIDNLDSKKKIRSVEQIAIDEGKLQQSDEVELKTIAEKIVADNPTVVTEYKNGKTSVIQFLVGQGMKATKGSGNPEVLKQVFIKLMQ